MTKILKNEAEKGKIPEHIFRYVENELYSYRTYQVALAELERDLKEVAEEYPQTLKDTISRQTGPSDPVALAATRAVVIEEKIKWNLSHIRKIEAGLRVLRAEEKQLLETKYFSEAHYSNEQIITQLRLSRNCFYRIRNVLIYKFALIFGML